MLGTLQQPAISENGDNLKSDVVELMINEFLTVFELASKWANEHGTSTLITFFLLFFVSNIICNLKSLYFMFNKFNTYSFSS